MGVSPTFSTVSPGLRPAAAAGEAGAGAGESGGPGAGPRGAAAAVGGGGWVAVQSVAPAAGTHGATPAMVVVIWEVPKPTTAMKNNPKARTMCDTDPATSTTRRLGAENRWNARARSCAGTTSVSAMPMMRTYPPAGMALSPYSVSPRRNDQSFGPKPTKYSVTFMP